MNGWKQRATGGTLPRETRPRADDPGLRVLARFLIRSLETSARCRPWEITLGQSWRIVIMSLIVNYNAAAFNAHRNLQMTDRAVGVSVSHLSSGLRVNTAADDPAGLVISESLRAQSEGLGQAIRNSNDGVNLIKTAEAALNEVNNLLRQMRTLAVHA